jgi:D-alanine-D-alanine ligase
MKILIITGGNSSERPVSLRSAKEVAKALLKSAYEVELYDLSDGYEPLDNLSRKFDVLFPVLHGEEGEGGKLHEFLTKLNKPIVGSKNYKGFQEAWYKIPFKQFCDKHDVLTPPWKLVKRPEDVISFGFPCVVKTSSGGSSREVFILKSKQDLDENQQTIFQYKDLFVEKYITGTEVTVGIFNDKALPVIEIIPPNEGWFDYKNKYSGETQEMLNAPSLTEKLRLKIQEIALKLHRDFDLGSYSRIDFMVDKSGNPYVMDINTIPGLTSTSLLPKETGMPFEQFIDKLVKLSLDNNPPKTAIINYCL